jgi:hypothetical protein
MTAEVETVQFDQFDGRQVADGEASKAAGENYLQLAQSFFGTY